MPTINTLPKSSSAQRGGLNHQAIEDYLKTIYELSPDNKPVSTNQLAHAREVKAASASGMIKRLAKLNLVHYEKHRGVTLTDQGRQIALEVLRHHRLIELYLIEALNFTWDEVHEQADILEHVISEKLEDRIAAALGYPKFDPHGAPIPTKDGEIESVAGRPLTMLETGSNARIVQVLDDQNGELLRYLANLGLQPGAVIILLAVAPFDGPLTVEVDGHPQVVGRKAAKSVIVEVV